MLQAVVNCGDGTPCADAGGGEDIASLIAAVSALSATVRDLQARVQSLSSKLADPEAAVIPSIKTIRAVVSSHFGVTESQMQVSRGRSSKSFLARRVACHLACRMTKHAAMTIAPLLGYADHSGVLFSHRAIGDMRLHDPAFDEEMTRLESALSKQVPTNASKSPCNESLSPSPAPPDRANQRQQSIS
jgi:chromosomal replication initiation ATPase DnaA